MKAYKIEVLYIDHENIAVDDIKEYIENVRYLYPRIKSIQAVEIGEWDDSHPLNKRETADAEYKRLFENM